MTRSMQTPERRQGGFVVEQNEDWPQRRRYRRATGAGSRLAALRGAVRRLRPNVVASRSCRPP